MSDAGAHCKAWKRNKDRAFAYAKSFEGDDPCWSIVFSFYAAVHLTQGYLVTKAARFEASNHQDRSRAIKASPELKPQFRESYKDLKDLSENIRYDPTYVASDEDYQKALKWLGVVESFLTNKLKTQLSE